MALGLALGPTGILSNKAGHVAGVGRAGGHGSTETLKPHLLVSCLEAPRRVTLRLLESNSIAVDTPVALSERIAWRGRASCSPVQVQVRG